MKNILKLTFTLGLAGTFFACETRTTTTTNIDSDKQDTVTVVRRSDNAADELKDFKNWVNSKAGKADSTAKENWPEVKEEFKQRSARLESRMDSLSAESKAEYAELKSKYKSWETQKQQRTSMPLDPNKLVEWEKQLIGTDKSLATLTAADMRETYLLFMGMVRAKKNKWTQDDWDYVDNIYGRLNERKQKVEGAMGSGDKIKVKTLQAEYLTLEASHDAKDLYKSVNK